MEPEHLRLMSRVILQQEEVIAHLRQEKCFVMFMKHEQEGILRPLMMVAKEWNDKKNKSPELLDSPLRTLMLQSMLQELLNRVQKEAATEEGRATLMKRGWLTAEHGIRAWDMPYFPGRGGVFLKDAAVLAGLGCVGRNNLFLAPEHGPRIRLRAMGMDLDLPSSGMIDFDPCLDCEAPCRKVCPQEALSQTWPADQRPPFYLPARDGVYDRKLCNHQMEADIAAHRMVTPPGYEQPSKQVHYCRRCEIVCLAGRGQPNKQ